ncbi:MAG TPA: hypothetical protein VM734_34965 [Kofleriaceae bacterium]|nr:hypothetical protein [Kofleriaceae bacterium]
MTAPTTLVRIVVAAALAAGAVALAGCGTDEEPFRLKIIWRDGPDQGCPALAAGDTRRCESIPMTCSARARIRIVDADQPEQAYFTQCFDLPAGGDACKLGALEIPRRQIPNTMVRVQVAVWPTDSLDGEVLADDGCPVAARYRLDGLPEPVNPLPALGGEAYFDVGHDRTAEVELGCPDSEGLACKDDTVTVEAQLFDLGFKRPQLADVARLTVKFGKPVDRGDGTWTIGNDQLVELRPTTTGELSWRVRLDDRPEGVHCLSVLYQSGPSTPALTCFEPEVDAGVLHARGFIVKSDVVASVLASMSQPGFPPDGVVIGLVLDDTDLPVAGAVVTPTPASPLHYPEPGFPPLARDQTSSLGMFVSLEAPFDATWQATDALGASDDGTARGGLVEGHVSVVIARIADRLAPDAGLMLPDPVDAGVDAP